jgi:hypothetical protein
MPAERKPASPILLIGMILFPAGLVSDAFLHLPRIVSFVLLGGAFVCMLLGLRAMRRQQRDAPPVPVDQRHKRFAMIFVAALVGCIIAAFMIPVENAHFSFLTRALIALGSFVIVTGATAWAIYFRRGKPPNQT